MLLHCLAQPAVEDQVRYLFIKMLRQNRIRGEVIEMVKAMTEEEKMKDLTAMYFSQVFKTPGMLEAVSHVLAEGAIRGMERDQTVINYAHFIMKVVNTDIVTQGMKKTFITDPLWSLIGWKS